MKRIRRKPPHLFGHILTWLGEVSPRGWGVAENDNWRPWGMQ